jgi:hypothetical protein
VVGGGGESLEKLIQPSYLPPYPLISTVSYASTITLNLAGLPDRAVFRCTLTGPVNIDVTGASDGQNFSIELTQDSTGSRTVALQSVFTLGDSELEYVTGGYAVSGYTAASAYIPSTQPGLTDFLYVTYNAATGNYRVTGIATGFQ